MLFDRLLLLQQNVGFGPEAPLGTGLEWMTLGAVLIPALLLVVLVYLGAEEAV